MRALDLGTGTGTIARGLALRGCDVTGLDRSAPLMEQAAELDRVAGVVVTYVNAPAEETGTIGSAIRSGDGWVNAGIGSIVRAQPLRRAAC